MNKIKSAFCTMVTLIGGTNIVYANETELRRSNQSRTPIVKADPGAKDNAYIISDNVFMGAGAAGKFKIAGDGLIIEPLNGNVSLMQINAEGGSGRIGGNGLASYNQNNKHVVIDRSILRGGESKSGASGEGRKSAGGAGAFCRTAPCATAPWREYLQSFDPLEKGQNFGIGDGAQPFVLDIKRSSITGGDLSTEVKTNTGDFNSHAGHGIKITGTALVQIDNTQISSGAKDKQANGINLDNGLINIVESSINTQKGVGIKVKQGPSRIIADKSSEIIGKKAGSIGIEANDQCDVSIEGRVKGDYYSVLFMGDDNRLTLQPGYKLSGKIAARGNNNHLTLNSFHNDDISFSLNMIDTIDHKQGFTELHKTGDGNWTLHDKNRAGNGLQKVLVTKGSLTLAEGASLWTDNVHVDAGAFFGGSGTIRGSVNNAGTLFFGKSKHSTTYFKTLTIDGDYHGDGQGALMFNTKLGGDRSQTDKLVIRGEATGQSQVLVTNRGGKGAKTDKGIPIIQVMGDTLAPAGTFRLAQRVVAGTYDYFLKQEGNTWLLTTDVPTDFFESLIPAAIAPTQPTRSLPRASAPPRTLPLHPAVKATMLSPVAEMEQSVPLSSADISPAAPSTAVSMDQSLPSANADIIPTAPSAILVKAASAPSISADIVPTAPSATLIKAASAPSISADIVPMVASTAVSMAPSAPPLMVMDNMPLQPAASFSTEEPATAVPPKKPPRTYQSSRMAMAPRNAAMAESNLPVVSVEPSVAPAIVLSEPVTETESASSADQPDSVATRRQPAQEDETNHLTAVVAQDASLAVSAADDDQEPSAEVEGVRHHVRTAARPVARNAADVAAEPDAIETEVNPAETEPAVEENVISEEPFPDDEPDDEPALPPSDTAVPSPAAPLKAYRPEPGSYLANLAVSNMLFTTGMQDRIGDPAYPLGLDNQDNPARPTMWLRTVGGRGKASMAGGQVMTRTYRHLVQLGGEVLSASSNGNDGLHLGLMAGQGQSHHHSRAALTGYSAKGGLNGYAVGVYASWFQNEAGREGMYLDGSLNYNWFDNRVKGESLSEERYGSRGMTATLETGYQWQWYQTTGFSAHFQPQMQLAWMGVKASHTEANGDRMVSLGSGNLQSRIGGRLYLEMHSVGGADQNLRLKPYIESSWIHNSRAFGVEINGNRLYQDGGRDIAELKIGHEGQLNRHVALWGNVGQRIGGEGLRDTVGTLGIKARF